jgi:mevalonate kinase
MSRLVCSAPGKLFLGGEYAVLNGAEAVVTAVDRRVVSRTVDKEPYQSPIIVEAKKHALDYIKSRHPDAPSPAQIAIGSTGFQIGRQKIGLGSSAAACAAAVGIHFESADMSIAKNRDAIFKVAMAAHKSAQKGKGSGADVAAAVFGGTLIFSMKGVLEPVPTCELFFVPVWSGRSASTTELIGFIEAFENRDKVSHNACMDRITHCAGELADAFRSATPTKIIQMTADYGELMNELGRLSGAPIVTREHGLITQLAHDLGGAAKPSGAGGGDVAMGLFDNEEAAAEFRKYCLRHELVSLEIDLGAPGLRRDSGDEHK